MDNTTSHGILTIQLTPKQSKATYMRFYWLRDRNNQNQLHLCWKPGSEKLADYHTNQNPPGNHRKSRSIYLALNTFTLQK